ncbi:MAG: hypothetical protein H0Z28_09150 [Archaeoglobus sp.]|nr:hypothetical protein [Archaeoglobus sp.]
MNATKTIFLKNVGKSDKGLLAIYYLYPAIKIDKIVLKGIKLENASTTRGKDVVFLVFELPIGETGKVEIHYESPTVLFRDFGWFTSIFRNYTVNDKQTEISPIYFLDERFNGTTSNYTILLNIPPAWNGTILDSRRMEGYWSSMGVEEGGGRKVLAFASNSSKSPFAILGLFDWVTSDIDFNGKQVRITLLLPRELEGKNEVIKTVEDILRTYSEWYGEYPFSFLQIVVSRTVAPHAGMNGIYGVVLISDTFDEWLLSHELAHFWFGSKARFGKMFEIDESLASYSSVNYFVQLSQKKGEPFAHSLDFLENQSLKYNISLRKAYSTYTKSLTWDEIYAIIYRKGAMVFRSLQFVVGDEMFFKSMKELLKECRACGLNDIQEVFERISGEDLNWFFEEWFNSPKAPNWVVDNLSFENHSLSFEIWDENDLKMPVEIEVITPAEVISELVWVDGVNKTHVTFNIEKKPERIVIDPNEWMVNWNRKYSLGGIEIVIN